VKDSARQKVFEFMDKNPETTNKDIHSHFEDYPENSVKTYRTQWLNKKKTKSTVEELKSKLKEIKTGSTAEERKVKKEKYRAILKKMSIKAKLKLLGESVVDDYLLTGSEPRVLGKAIDLLCKEEFIMQGEIIHDIFWTSETPPYKRPEFLYDHQLFAMNLMSLGHLLWQASRQLAGKTTVGLLMDFEDMLLTRDFTVALVAPTVPLAAELLTKFFNSTIRYEGESYRFYDLLKPYLLKDPNQMGFALKNGSRLLILSLKQSGSQGRTIDVIHVEELDKLGQEANKRAGLAGIINSIRANPNARVRIFCNDAKGIFRLLKAELFRFGRYFSIYIEDPFSPDDEYSGSHTVINEDVIVEKVPTLDNILYIFSEILVSAAFAEGQLYNVEDVTDECFNPDMYGIAYDKPRASVQINVKTTMGIDPGGKKNAFGVSIWSLTNEEQVNLRWIKRFYNAKHTAQEQARIIAEKYIHFKVEICQVESSAGSPWSMSLIGDEVRKQSGGKIKFKFIYINFEGEGKTFDKMNFVYMFKILLDYEKVLLYKRDKEEKELEHQITLYNPNKTESGTNPSDLIESTFHCIWVLLGGMNYIKKLIEKVNTPVVLTM